MVDNLNCADGCVAASRTYRRQNLALSRVGERMQTRESADIVKVGYHIGIEDDLRDGGRRSRSKKKSASS
jgi:hypothetical protein